MLFLPKFLTRLVKQTMLRGHEVVGTCSGRGASRSSQSIARSAIAAVFILRRNGMVAVRCVCWYFRLVGILRLSSRRSQVVLCFTRYDLPIRRDELYALRQYSFSKPAIIRLGSSCEGSGRNRTAYASAYAEIKWKRDRTKLRDWLGLTLVSCRLTPHLRLLFPSLLISKLSA